MNNIDILLQLLQKLYDADMAAHMPKTTTTTTVEPLAEPSFSESGEEQNPALFLDL
jgi:hypothetical protein